MIKNFKIAILLSYICTASISAAIITPALPAIEKTYHLNHGALEWIVSIFLVGYMFGQLLYGPIANRFGRLNALRSGLAVNLLGIIICIIAIKLHCYSLLLLGRLITALGAACGLTCTVMLINELLSPDKIKQALSYSVVSFTLGVGLAVLIGGLITQYLSWPDCFVFLLFHGLIMLILTWQFPETLKKSQSLQPKTIIKSYALTLHNKTFIAASIIIGFLSVFTYSYSVAGPIYTQIHLQLSASQYGYWNGLNMLGMLLSGLLAAKLIKSFGVINTLKFSLICIAPAVLSLVALSLLNQSSVLWFFLTTTALYLFTGLLFPVGSHLASEAIKDKANGSSMMSFINMGSATLSVIVLGYLPMSSIHSFAFIISVFFLLVIILSFRFFKTNPSD